jgi:hypothetical protein
VAFNGPPKISLAITPTTPIEIRAAGSNPRAELINFKNVIYQIYLLQKCLFKTTFNKFVNSTKHSYIIDINLSNPFGMAIADPNYNHNQCRYSKGD